MTQITFFQRAKAPNDINGNPRRLFIIYKVSENGAPYICDILDEGYGGVPRHLQNVPSIMEMTIKPMEYNRLLKHGRIEKGPC